jgi:hypothetical protein
MKQWRHKFIFTPLHYITWLCPQKTAMFINQTWICSYPYVKELGGSKMDLRDRGPMIGNSSITSRWVDASPATRQWMKTDTICEMWHFCGIVHDGHGVQTSSYKCMSHYWTKRNVYCHRMYAMNPCKIRLLSLDYDTGLYGGTQ